jgi:uncharacterized protein
MMALRQYHEPYPNEARPMPRTLTGTEYDQLNTVLARLRVGDGGGGVMNLESLDGFFAALICCPNLVPPSEYLPVLWGGKLSHERGFATLEEWRAFMALLMRHWSTIASTLKAGEEYLPLLFVDKQGATQGRDWAGGFVRGIALRKGAWQELLNDAGPVCVLMPILALAHEHTVGAESRQPEPIDAALRAQFVAGLSVSLVTIYRCLEPQRRLVAQRAFQEALGMHRQNWPTQELHKPCACGSGLQYKHCCGRIVLH